MTKRRYHRHGMTGSALLNIYSMMVQRCYNPNSKSYGYYGGRGIKICDRWLHGDPGVLSGVECFAVDMGPRPSRQYSIERKDVNGNYEPSNCIWLLKSLQPRNARSNVHLTAFGKTQLLTDWSRELGVPIRTITSRMERKWPIEHVLSATRWDGVKPPFG